MKWFVFVGLLILAFVALFFGLLASADPEGRGGDMTFNLAVVACVLGFLAVSSLYYF